MKNTKETESKQMSLKERIASELGDRLTVMAVQPRGCFNFFAYEPKLSCEMILEMHDVQNS